MENFAKKLAINHHTENKSSIKTFPIKEIKEDFNVISKAYNLLGESIYKDVSIPPSGEWLLDNYYIIEEQYHSCVNNLSRKEYKKMPSVSGKARILILARELVEYTDGNINEEVIQRFIISYQTKRSLNLDEISIFPLMLKLSLIHHIRIVAERILIEQLEKFKVESLIERIVAQKTHSRQQFKEYRKVCLNGEVMTYIEYLIYSLKKLGRDDLIDILEEEIIKKGTTSSEIIKTLHFDMAIRRISISNSITSLKNLARYNWTVLFEKMNPVETILKQDIVYEKMSYQTKQAYLEEIKKIAKKASVSEVYIGSVLVELSKKQEKHVGFFLFGEERKMLAEALDARRIYKKKLPSGAILFLLITGIYAPSIFVSALLFKNYYWIGLLPISEIFVTILTYFISKAKKPKLLMQIEDVDSDVLTFVIVPTLLNSKERVLKLMNDMEIYYLANKDARLKFCLLGDASESETEVTSFDVDVENAGISKAEELNEKYGEDIFYFIYRKRIYNPSQEKWLGYERKRGMIEEFNHFLITKEEGTFLVNTIKEIPKVKYIITIDADTNLVLGSAKKLIGIMEHPLNEPVIKNGRVVGGYGLVQPKISISIKDSNKTLFSKLFSGSGGLDMYSGAESNLYQDLFEEAIFTGKGIFRIDVYEKLLYHKIPENKVLSHDLIEGSFLKTGLASNVSFMDGFPARVNSYFFRLKRWTRGDIQIIFYLFNPYLNAVSKYKIWDNIRRSIIPIFTFTLFCLGFFKEALFILFFPFLWDAFLMKRNIFKLRKKNFFFRIQGVMASFYRCGTTLFFLPYKAILMLEAIFVTLYRMLISKKHLLEWTTAADSERMLGKSFKSYVLGMKETLIMILVFALYRYNSFGNELLTDSFLIITWILSPVIAYCFSREEAETKLHLKENELVDIKEIAKRTWDFFDTFITIDNNFLMPDNYQESRKRLVTKNTSSTNIGLSLLAVISACDLGFITKDEMIEKIKKILNTVFELSKWQGHLYNWYDVTTKKPLEPRFISTVDSGNFVAYLYVVRNILDECGEEDFVVKVQRLIDETNFSALYDNNKNLFSIGYDERERKLVDSYYDLLASEARTASYVAICKRDVSYKHWFYLGRSMTQMNGYQGLLSWAGTMFEYFMPRVIINPYKGTLLSETQYFCIESQQRYANKLNIPWGISESAFYLQDFHLNFQYKAFGIPWLGLKRGLKDEVVVSPYSSLMAISEAPKDVVKNIKRLKQMNAYDKYGFYESIDYTPSRVKENYEIVKTYMAHHQALILLSINNFLNEDILVNRFMENPEIKSAEILLEEKVPEKTVFTKEKKEKAKPLKYQDYEEYTEKVIHKEKKNVNILSGEDITLFMNDFGEGYVETNGVLFYPYKEDKKVLSPIFIKDKQNDIYWTNTIKPGKKKPDNSSVRFSPAFCEFVRTDDQIVTSTKYIVSSEDRVVLKELELYNGRDLTTDLDVYSMDEVILCSRDSFISHPAYQGLFLSAQNYNNDVLIEKRFHHGQMLYYMNFATIESSADEKFEIELDKLKVIGRGRSMENPLLIEQDKMMSNEIYSTISPVIAIKKNIILEPDTKVKMYFYSMVADNLEEMESLYEKYHKFDMAKRIEELAIGKAKIENRFLGFKGKEILKFHEILAELFNGSDSISKNEEKRKQNKLKKQNLWKFGISGDLPIILIKTNKLSDAFLLDKYIRAMVYFYHKHIGVDLVILNGEKNSYEQYNQDKIYELLSKENASFLLNQNGGIHVLKETLLNVEEQNLIYAVSDMIVEEKN